MLPTPRRSTLFPYTTLFRSGHVHEQVAEDAVHQPRRHVAVLRESAEGDLHFIQAVVAGLVDARRLAGGPDEQAAEQVRQRRDRKSTRLNSSHQIISYAVFCL